MSHFFKDKIVTSIVKITEKYKMTYIFSSLLMFNFFFARRKNELLLIVNLKPTIVTVDCF